MSLLLSLLLPSPADACGGNPGGVNMADARPRPPEVTVDITEPDALFDEAVHQTLRRHRNALHYCYARQLLRDEQLGSLTLEAEVTVAPDGGVSAVITDGTDEAVGGCYETIFSRMRMPTAEIFVTSTLVFELSEVEPAAPTAQASN